MSEIEKKLSSVKKVARKEVSREFARVRFPSQNTDTFRASITTVTEGVVPWLENKKNKQQW